MTATLVIYVLYCWFYMPLLLWLYHWLILYQSSYGYTVTDIVSQLGDCTLIFYPTLEILLIDILSHSGDTVDWYFISLWRYSWLILYLTLEIQLIDIVSHPGDTVGWYFISLWRYCWLILYPTLLILLIDICHP